MNVYCLITIGTGWAAGTEACPGWAVGPGEYLAYKTVLSYQAN